MSLNASFEAFMAVMYKVVVVLFVTACGVVVGYQCFGGACCLRLQGEVLLNNQRAYQPPYRHLRCYALWCSQYNCALFRVFSFVKNGVLYLRPTLTADEYGEHVLYRGAISAPGCNMDPCVSSSGEDIVLPIQSARIRTVYSFSFLYGRLEVRAKMPRGDWLWPAIWLKPRYNDYGLWPASGEIDVVETRANKKLTNAAGVSQGIDTMGATLHFGLNSSYNIWRPTHWEKSIAESGRDFSEDFHVFGLTWTPDYLNFTVDGKLIGSRGVPDGGFWKLGGFDKIPGARNIWKDGKPMAPFDKRFFIIMNVAVGGNYFPDGWYNSPHPKPWNSSSPHPIRDFWEHRHWWLPTWDLEDRALRVDYIRVYSLDGE